MTIKPNVKPRRLVIRLTAGEKKAFKGKCGDKNHTMSQIVRKFIKDVNTGAVKL